MASLMYAADHPWTQSRVANLARPWLNLDKCSASSRGKSALAQSVFAVRVICGGYLSQSICCKQWPGSPLLSLKRPVPRRSIAASGIHSLERKNNTRLGA